MKPHNALRKSHVHWKMAVLAVVLGLLTFHSGVALAQTSAYGSIYGQVTDSSGAPVVGAQITAHSPSVGGTFNAVSDNEGNYRLIELPPATDYTVDTENAGFEKFERVGLVVEAG